MASLLHTTDNTRAVLPGTWRFIRSDAPANLDEGDIAWLREHDVRTVVDLREPWELEKKPCRLRELPDFTYHNLPVTGGNRVPDTPAEVGPWYLSTLDDQMRRILDTMEQAQTNVIFFCAAGKDRTGIVSALLQHRAGLSREEIIADYLLTAENMRERIAGYVKRNPQWDIVVLTPQRWYMEQLLDGLADRGWA